MRERIANATSSCAESVTHTGSGSGSGSDSVTAALPTVAASRYSRLRADRGRYSQAARATSAFQVRRPRDAAG